VLLTAAAALQNGGSAVSGQLAKVCGITNKEDALAAAAAGANLIGIVFAEKSPRCATLQQAQEIVAAVRAFGERKTRKELLPPPQSVADSGPAEWFTAWARILTVSV
jgi:N-(5'phosphoribosyl)anthranilate (PRA) isomerase